MQRKPKNYMENSDSSDLVEWGVSVETVDRLTAIKINVIDIYETPLPPKTEIKKAFFLKKSCSKICSCQKKALPL